MCYCVDWIANDKDIRVPYSAAELKLQGVDMYATILQFGRVSSYY